MSSESNKTEGHQMFKNLKQKLEKKFANKTIDSIDERDLPQIDKDDLNQAIAGVPIAFVFIFIALGGGSKKYCCNLRQRVF